MRIESSYFYNLYPFRSNFMDINGLQYHYVDEGAGKPVVMLHGNPTWSFYYRSLIKNLSPNYRAIAVDHIGCGLSDKPKARLYGYRLKNRIDDFEMFMDRLQLKDKINLILHDWGGMIGMAYALNHIDTISSITITNTAAFLPPNGKKIPFRLWLVRNIKPLAVIGVLGFNLFAKSALRMASRKGLSENVKAGLIAPYDRWKNRIATLKFVQDIPVKQTDPSYGIVKTTDENLHKLSTIPMLICWGRHDFVFDQSYLAEWEKRFPHAEAHLFDDAGHYALEDVPDKIIPLVREFIGKNAG